MKRQGQILRIIRTTADLPAFIPTPTHRTVPDVYDPWFCVACGHPHHEMTRHHRVPRRIFMALWIQPMHTRESAARIESQS